MTYDRKDNLAITMSESADSLSEENISYLEDVDSDIGKFYADTEPPTDPQTYMYEPEAACAC